MRQQLEIVPLIPSLAAEVIERANAGALLRDAGIAQTYMQACNEFSRAALVDGAAVAMAGILPVWRGRAAAWAVIGPVPQRCWPAITRSVLAMLEQAHLRGYRRIEATVDPGHPAACRWIRRLGFDAYGLLENYTPADGDGNSRDLIGVCRLWPPRSDEQARNGGETA